MEKPNKVQLTLIKNATGITAVNEYESKIDYFDDAEESRKAFIKYMLDEFINKEIKDGPKYK